MPRIKLINVNKYYSKENHVVYDFNLDIKDKEFVVLVGPSGCGKSTTLRMIAGLEDITSGELYIDDRLVNDVQAKDRGISMVFQSYALFPNLSVRRNISYGLEIRKVPTIVKKKAFDKETHKFVEKELVLMRKMPKDEINKRVNSVAEMLGLVDYLDRKPKALSGGQKQRVALGRTIVRDTKVFLMDEPLSNLDAKLRVQMRKEITDLHHRIGATTVYVTHDQLEAMTMADRIVIMNKGVVQQIGTPEEVYNNPKNKFVASFIGSPTMNFFKGIVNIKEKNVTVSNQKIKINQKIAAALDSYSNKELWLGIRAEDLIVDRNGELSGEITMVELLGKDSIVHVKFENYDIAIYSEEECNLNVGDQIRFNINLDRIHVFNENEDAIKLE